jgi:hypothetical protein
MITRKQLATLKEGDKLRVVEVLERHGPLINVGDIHIFKGIERNDPGERVVRIRTCREGYHRNGDNIFEDLKEIEVFYESIIPLED